MLYVLYGPDSFSRTEKLTQIKIELDSDGSLSSGTAVFDARQATPQEVVAACETLPFLSPHRLVIVEDPALGAFNLRTAAFAAIVLFICRPVILLLVLSRFRLPWQDKVFAAWHGPRGLGSILLALIVVISGASGGDQIFAVTGIVVLASVILHGILGTPLVAWSSRAPAAVLVPEPENEEVARITALHLAGMIAKGEPVLVADVRQPGALDRDPRRIPTAVHYPPDEAAARIAENPPKGPIVLYCA